jgi:hypothetical protein
MGANTFGSALAMVAGTVEMTPYALREVGSLKGWET